MTPSLVKILDGGINKSETKLTLIVELLKGIPKVKDCVYFLEQAAGTVGGDIIEEVNATSIRGQYEVVIGYDPQYPIWETHWKDYPDDQKLTAICALTVHDFQYLSTNDKKTFISVLADILGVGRVPGFVQSHLEPALYLNPSGDYDGISKTKFGGLPLAPKGFTFPKDNHGNSLLFIGQMHIGELKQRFKTCQQFKGNGILYFFGTTEVSNDVYHGVKSLMVQYSEATKDLHPVALPKDLVDYGIFEEIGMDILEEITIPDTDSSFWPGETITDEERESFNKLYFFLEPYTWNLIDYLQLLGNPASVQQCVLFEAQLSHLGKAWPSTDEWEQVVQETRPLAKEWKMLLTLDIMNEYFRKLSKFSGEFNEYMDGNFYLLIKKADFDMMKFDNTVSIYQST